MVMATSIEWEIRLKSMTDLRNVRDKTLLCLEKSISADDIAVNCWHICLDVWMWVAKTEERAGKDIPATMCVCVCVCVCVCARARAHACTRVGTQCEIYPDNKFFSVQYNIVDYMYSIIQQISRAYSFCLTEILCLSIHNSPLSFPSNWQSPFHSVSVSLTIFSTSYNWNHAVFFLRQPYFI